MIDLSKVPPPKRDTALAVPGVLLAFVGAFGTWVVGPGGYTSGGLSHGGKLTLLVSLAAGAMIAFAWWKETVPPVIGVGGAAALLLIIAAVNIGNVKSNNLDGFFSEKIDLSVGWGLWATVIGGLLVGGAAALSVVRPASSFSDHPEE